MNKRKVIRTCVIFAILFIVLNVTVFESGWVLVPRWYRNTKSALQTNRQRARSDIRGLQPPLVVAKQLCGASYPSTEEGNKILASSTVRRPDPWGTPYGYALIHEKPQIMSAGPDKKFGTQDDINSHWKHFERLEMKVAKYNKAVDATD